MTYNQSKYILDALNGFVMQKTDFPFVCLVMDDASTDGEPEVIKGFLDRECAMESAEFSEIEEANIVVVPHKTNPNCTMAVYLLKKNLFGTGKKTPLIAPWRECCKYEALCEGDDYWIDSEKLQKQFDFLEKNVDYVLCYHNVVEHNEKTGKDSYLDTDETIPQTAGIYQIASGNFISTLSVFYRIIPAIYDVQGKLGRTDIGDYIMWLLLSQYGLLYRMSERMAVYRSGIGMWSHISSPIEHDLKMLRTVAKLCALFDDKEIQKRIDDQLSCYYSNIMSSYMKLSYSYNIVKSSKEYKLGTFLLGPFYRLKDKLSFK